MLIAIMSRFGKKRETESKVPHNERLEFLGDAVVEFITSVHLFFMFPDLEEGGLATYRYINYMPIYMSRKETKRIFSGLPWFKISI